MKIYCIYDRKAQRYSKPSLFINEDVAKRDYQFALSQSLNLSILGDCELYYLGDYDESTGIIKAVEKPEYIYSFSCEVK